MNIINHLDIISIAQVKSNTTVTKAAELLMAQSMLDLGRQ
jgi:hypothetical protein